MIPVILASSLLFSAVSPELIVPLNEKQRSEALTWIAKMKVNRRGPFAGVMWFCKDGAILPPKRYACVEHGGGLQYGVPSEETKKLGKAGIHVGTILTALSYKDLLADDYYRARALIVETYLERALNGWTLQSSRNYRGFRQVEDEQESARWLLLELTKRKEILYDQRSLIIRLIRALPYGRQGSLADEIRGLAGVIGDADRDFDDLRFKIHAMPEPADVPLVEAYAAKKSGELAEMATTLIGKMKTYYDPVSRVARLITIKQWIHDDATKELIDQFVALDFKDGLQTLTKGYQLMLTAEKALVPGSSKRTGERNLLLLHAMELVEELWIGITADLASKPMTREQGLQTTALLARSARVLGLLSVRELETAEALLRDARRGDATDYAEAINDLGRMLEWARARLLADVGLALLRYESVEPRARGVIDDILRSGVVLPMAAVLDRLSADVEKLRGGGHHLIGIDARAGASMRGENPGLAIGPLKVLEAGGNPRTLKRHQIVLLNDLPPSLPPVAGIITVGSAGSLSHVALLARNLGIPHASVGGDVALKLRSLENREIVTGVSMGKRICIGALDSFPRDQRIMLGRRKIASTPFLEIDTKMLDLKTTRIHMLSEISEKDSGRRVGPKAAELGRLKALFPGRVSNAAVIPFGAFLRHVDRAGPSGEPSPMARLRAVYKRTSSMVAEEAEKVVLEELKTFREAILTLPFPPGFEAEVDAALAKLGAPGSFGVFIRSDTNVEDLKEFTGAGLNKTVPHRVKRESIIAAVRKVWQSPYTERSYRWRQRILKNPEDVYPSVILHKTVPSEFSGVMVTTDMYSNGKLGRKSLTVSASEGVAAVVDGGAPETIVISPDGSVRLLASARSATRKRIPDLPGEGVIVTNAEGRDPLLGDAEVQELLALAKDVRRKIPNPDRTPWDIEFGFLGGKVWLLQIRPLRTSRAPASNPFLVMLDKQAKLPKGKLDFSVALPR